MGIVWAILHTPQHECPTRRAMHTTPEPPPKRLRRAAGSRALFGDTAQLICRILYGMEGAPAQEHLTPGTSIADNLCLLKHGAAGWGGTSLQHSGCHTHADTNA